MACGRSRIFGDDGVRGLVAYTDIDVRDVPIRFHLSYMKTNKCNKGFIVHREQ
jgi:hypothetical protein